MTPHTLPTAPLGWLPFLWQTVLFPGRPAHDTAMRWPALVLVIVLPALLVYPFRAFHLLEPDEGRYAQIPKEMLVSGQWVVPTLQSEPYLDKPPLMYWLIAISYSVFGVTPEAARLVPAVCVHLTVLLVYLLGRRGSGERPAFWAAMLLSVAPGFVGVARLLLLDGLLTLCVTASVLCGFEAVRTGVLLRRWWYLSAIASGLGFLTKGPISEVLLLPPLFAFGWLSGSTARVGWRSLLGFAGVVAAVNLPWYAAMMVQAPAFLKYFFLEHNLMRFLQPFDHLQPIWYYLPIVLGGLLPGTILGIGYVRWLLLSGPETAERRSATGGFWLLAGGWCVLFFSLSGSKLPTYILPAFPFLCLALGEFVVGARRERLAATLVTVFGGVVLAVHAFGVPWYAQERSPFGRPDLVTPYVTDPRVPVVTYPRNVDSVAFYTDRADFDRVRSKDVNQLIVDMHHRPRTVVLFTHRHSYESFREALPDSLSVADVVTLKRPIRSVWDKLTGDTPWGLTDVAVIVPAATARGQRP